MVDSNNINNDTVTTKKATPLLHITMKNIDSLKTSENKTEL